SKQEFLDSMTQLIESDERVYQAMMLDIYQMGTVLYAKKYRWLSYSYRIFLLGLLLTAVATIAVYQNIY
ncbi:MAG: Pycsar system effector family protein, partial [bacterium]